MRLTFSDKVAYWAYWLCGHGGGIMPCDWVAEWNSYLRGRAQGLTPWQAFTLWTDVR
jgi:hypothetical protein